MLDSQLQTCDRFCIFGSGGSWFALPAVSIREVLARPDIVPVPQTERILAGLCHLRNEFLPVVDFRAVSGDGAPRLSDGEYLIVLARSGGCWGLIVDRVVGLEPLEISPAAHGADGGSWTGTVAGTAAYEDAVVRVLDPNGLYRFVSEVLEAGFADSACNWQRAHSSRLASRDEAASCGA